ncbi:hypothetical protein QMK19_10410 [Streptomyces sp. H10-C2]|uniref:hypothetical protein n=1 Tax=unclassified Streptomyces TaxID=2593676 RepID=UPI0024B91535|nr:MULTISPECIES: hypothetical protein [unclassified Streptomyces]MDJ0341953.1 hypothetical protein [Streptomyces sp. PH10-H1]MDJ0369926.1 hypothetical protein [Streptomyces sp. H10-C2]MDJ0370073.1 hypothetical protein [Streptomyces sp. H10-C2]
MFYGSHLITTARKGLAAIGCAALIASASAACGTVEQAGTGAKVKNAVDKLGEQKAVTTTVAFDATADQIWNAMKGEKNFTKDDAKMLAGLHATFGLSSDKPLKDAADSPAGKDGKGAKDSASSFAFQLSSDAAGKQNLVEVRSIGKKLYIRADVKALSALGSKAKGNRAELDRFLATADKLPSSLGVVKDALQGKWISVDPQAFTDFAKTLGGPKGLGKSPLPAIPDSSSFDAKTQRQLTDAVKNAVAHNAKFTDAGSKDGVDHVTMTVPAGQVAKELAKGLAPLEKQIPNFKASGLNDTPARNLTVDLSIKDGMLSGISLDAAQLAKKPAGKLPLVIGLKGGSDPVAAPDGAKALNPQDIMGLFMFVAMNNRGA